MGSSSSSAASNRKYFDMDGKKVKSGNLIEIFCDGYSHWAVYVGFGNIVHFVPHESWDGKGEVLKQTLEDVVEEDYWRVNNLLDCNYTPRAVNDIVNKACSLAITGCQYDLDTHTSEQFATEMRYGSPESRQEVKPGDLIEIFRHLYQHWGVYIGGGNVVDLVKVGLLDGKGKVSNRKLEDVVKKDKCTVNNLLDHKYTPRPADDIVNKACSLVDTELEYNLKKYNCEHFATDMRYGHPESQQVKAASEAGGVALRWL